MAKLLHWNSVEAWQQDNEYILRHYRPSSKCYWKSIKSLFYIHNQTGNIYSHLLGALCFALEHQISITSQYKGADRLLLSVFSMAAMTCLASSAYFHLMSDHSQQVKEDCLTMDFLGIICLIVATAFPLAFYTYPCRAGLLRSCLIIVCPASVATSVL